MKKLGKEFCLRGLTAMGFGPIVYGVVILIIHLCGVNTISDGIMIFKGIISTTIMAFIIAGISVIWQIEKIQIGIKIATHCLTLYFAYLIVYLLNDWLVKDFNVIGIFTLIFVVGYFLIWGIIYFTEKNKAKKLNAQIR